MLRKIEDFLDFWNVSEFVFTVIQLFWCFTAIYVAYWAFVSILAWVVCYVPALYTNAVKTYPNGTASQKTPEWQKGNLFPDGFRKPLAKVYLSKNDTQLPLAHIHELYLNDSIWDLKLQINPTTNKLITLDNEITRSDLKKGAAIRKRTILLRYQVKQIGLAIEAWKTSVAQRNKEVLDALKEIPEKLQDVITSEQILEETEPNTHQKTRAIWTDFFKKLSTTTCKLDDSIAPISKKLASLRNTVQELSIMVTKEILEIKKGNKKFDPTKRSIFKFASLEKTNEDLHAEEELLEALEQSIGPAQAIVEVAKRAVKSTQSEIAGFEKLRRKEDKQPIDVFVAGIESQIAAVLEKIEELSSLGNYVEDPVTPVVLGENSNEGTEEL